MARRFCCCSTGSDLCCGSLTTTSGWINGSPSTLGTRYYRISIPLSFTNNYGTLWTIGAENKGGIDCSIGGGCYGCSYDIPASAYGFGTSAGYMSMCLGLPCGGCKNGTCDEEDPPNCAPDGSGCGPDCGENPNGCVGVCLPYEWEEACCGDDGVGGTDCGARPSVFSLNEVVNTGGSGVVNLTLKTNSGDGDGGCPCRFCESCYGGNPGFNEGTGSSSVPASWYVTDTEYRDTQWNGGPTTGSPCGSTPNCQHAGMTVYCVDEMVASSPSYRYLSPLSVTASPPSGTVPFIDLNSYSGAYVALMSVKHKFETQDRLILEGDNCAGVAEDQGSDGTVDLRVGFVGACRPGGVDFVPFGTCGAETGTHTSYVTQSFSAGGFGVSFDLDKWET